MNDRSRLFRLLAVFTGVVTGIIVFNLSVFLIENFQQAVRAKKWMKNSSLVFSARYGWDANKVNIISEGIDSTKSTILFSGDSFTHNKLWPGMTINVLNRNHIGVNGVSLGVSGYGTIQSLLKLIDNIEKYKPELVIHLFFAWNDVRDNFNRPPIIYNFRMKERPYLVKHHGEFRLQEIPPWKRMARHYPLVRYLNLDMFDSDRNPSLHYADTKSWLPFYIPGNDAKEYVDGAWAATEEALKRMREVVNHHGAKLIVIGLGNAFTVDRDVREVYFQEDEMAFVDKALKRLKSICDRQKIQYVSSLQTLRTLSENTGRKVYQHSKNGLSAHLSERGEKAIAELAAAEIIKHLRSTSP